MAFDERPVAVDLFAGAGGTTFALRRAGFRVPVAVEIDPVKGATLGANNPGVRVLGAGGTTGDVTKIGAADLYAAGLPPRRRLALLVACPPCQGYSTQGKQHPKDPRNRLFEDLLRLAEELNPRAVVVENVPGMASTAGGRFLSQLVSGLEGFRYRTALWTLRADELGVPQSRERLFVVAGRGKLPTPPRRRRGPTVWDAIADLPSVPFRAQSRRDTGARYLRDPISAYAKSLRGSSRIVTGVDRSRHSTALIRRIHLLKPGEVDSATKHRRLDPRRSAGTITAGTRSRTACRPVHPYQDRVLTVREGARLASFPDSYRFPRVISEAWNQIGNAVPPLMAEAVFRRVRESLEAE